MRRLLIILVGLAAMVAVACGGGEEATPSEAEATPTAAAAVSPITTPAGQVAELPCEVPDDIKSYRFTYGSKMDMPGPELEEALEEAREAIQVAQQEERDVFAEWGEGWGALVFWFLALADMRMEGAFVAPDRVEVRVTFLGVLELTNITIGDKEWTKRGALDWEESTAEAEGLTWRRGLADLCEGFAFPGVPGLEAREETVNGVATHHYHLDEADLRRLAELFPGDTEEMWDAEDLLQEGTVDVWLAKEGNWPVRMEGEFTLEYGEIRDLTLSMFIEVKDLNDPSIKIEPPVPTLTPTTEPPGTTDRPPPAGGRGGTGVPMFRGNPGRTGVNPGPGVERSPTLLWRFRSRAPVESSPAVVEGTVYVGSFDDYVYALDAATGEGIWRFQTSGSVSSSPAVVEGAVYIGAYPGRVYALDAATGEERWRFEMDDYVGSSPAVVDGVVYIGGFREVYAIDAGTGEERWQFQTGRMSSSPAVVDDAVYIGTWDSGVYALEAVTGEERWRFEMGLGRHGAESFPLVESSPAVVDGVVYIGSNDEYVYAITEG